MTNFFGINVTKGQECTEMDSIAFVTRTLSVEKGEELEQFRQENEQMEQKASLPLGLRVLKGLCWIVWLIILCGILKSDVSIVQGYHNAPILYWAFGVCFIGWLVLLIYGRVRMKQAVNTDEFGEHMTHADKLERDVRTALDIPDHADSIDVLAERYVMKNGEPEHRDSGLVAYLNFDMWVFERDGSLCLADTEHVWEIPLSSLYSMTLEKKRRSYPEWHKSEPPGSKKYKPYKITTDSYGHYFSRCYRIIIRDARGEFYLLIPEFDGEIFTGVTHLRPECVS